MKHPAATLALAAGILLAAACPSAPAAIAGPDLAEICEGGGGIPADRFYKNCQRLDPPQVCYEYILGFLEGATVMIELLGEGRQLFCPPAGHGTPARALAIVLGYMQAHPEGREACGLHFMVTKALLTEWRCK